MSTAAFSTRDPFMPRPLQRSGSALTLALLAHALLITALALNVNWRNSEPTSVAAELWAAVPQVAAPRAVEVPTPPAPPVRKAEPVVKPAPPPEPEAQSKRDAQIAIEKAEREEAQRVLAEAEARRKKAEQSAKEEQAQKKAAADKLAKEKAAKAEAAEKADKLAKEKAEKVEAAKQAAIRDANLKRIQGLAGATGGATDTGTALHSAAPSANYAGRIMARIKPNIVFGDPIDGNPVAIVEVRLAPDGTIIGQRLTKSSGVKAWDDAVMRAIERTEVLPRDTDGRVPPPFPIEFRPRD